MPTITRSTKLNSKDTAKSVNKSDSPTENTTHKPTTTTTTAAASTKFNSIYRRNKFKSRASQTTTTLKAESSSIPVNATERRKIGATTAITTSTHAYTAQTPRAITAAHTITNAAHLESKTHDYVTPTMRTAENRTKNEGKRTLNLHVNKFVNTAAIDVASSSPIPINKAEERKIEATAATTTATTTTHAYTTQSTAAANIITNAVHFSSKTLDYVTQISKTLENNREDEGKKIFNRIGDAYDDDDI